MKKWQSFVQTSKKVLALLRDAYPQSVSTSQIVDALYGDDPDGGSEWAEQNVWLYIKRLRLAGYPIPHGGKVRGYRLERIS